MNKLSTRIALVTPRYAPHLGGLEEHVERLAWGLARSGHVVEVLTQETDRSLPAISHVDGVVVRRFRVPVRNHAFPVAPSLWTFLRGAAGRYDIVHGHGYHTLAAVGAAVTSPAPFVFTPHYHGTGHSPFRSALHHLYHPLGALGMRRSDSVICVSEAEARLVRGHFPAVSTRVVVIPNGIRVPRMPAAPPERDRDLILSLGRLETYKRVDLVVKALVHLPASVRLIVVGEGPARAQLSALAVHSGVADRVKFAGRLSLDAVDELLFKAAVVASLSEHEAFGMVVLEARAAGARVVANDIPAHREVVGYDDADGVALVDASNQGALVEALSTALAGTACRPTSTAPSWENVVSRTAECYAQVLAAAAVRR